MPVKSIDNWPGGRGFMAPRCRWRPRLRDTHKPFNQATFVTGPRTCLLGTFPNIPPTLNASRSKLIATIELKLIKNLNYLKNITYTKEDIKELRSLYTNVHHGLNIYYESVRIHCYSSSLVPWWDEYSCG